MAKYYVLARVYLDSGTEYLSEEDVSHPTRTYDGRVLNWGLIDRSIPVPAGIPQVSDSRIRIADPDRAWRNLSAVQALRRRFVDLKLVAHGASESAADTIFRGEIVDYSTGPAYLELTIRNRAFAWLDEEIPAFINEQNYGAGVKRAFLNIIQGHNISAVLDEPGAIPCPHIKWDSVEGDRFGLAAHPVEDVLGVYRKVPTKASAGDPEWMAVDPAEFNVGTEVDREFVEVPGIPFNPAYLDFIIEQEPGTLIRADVDGINYRGPWEGIPEVIGFQENRHPLNYFINMMYLVMHKAGTSGDVWDVSTIEDLLDVFEDFIPDSSTSSGFVRFKCDGAITEVITVREWLGRFCQSTQIQVLELVNGKLAVAYIGDTDPGRPIFKEGYHFIKDSFHERAAQPTVNQTRYHYARQYAAGQFELNEIFDNEEDQLAIGTPTLDSAGQPVTDSNGDTIIQPHVESDDVDLWFVRDELTALYIVGRRMNFLALGSLRQEWKMPLPEVLANIELAKLVGITHGMGAAVVGGYTNTEVAITNITIDLQRLMVTVRSILRVPVAINPPGCITCPIPFVVSESDIFDDDLDTVYDSLAIHLDTADLDGHDGARMEIVADTEFAAENKLIDVVRDGTTVIATSAPITPNVFKRLDIAFELTPGAHTYTFKIRAAASGDELTLLVSSVVIWVTLVDSRRAKVQVMAMAGGDQSTGGGAGSAALNNAFATFASREWEAGTPVFGFDTQAGGRYFSRWLFEAAKYVGVDSWELETIAGIFASVTNHGTGKTALFTAGDSMVAPTEKTFTGEVVTPTALTRQTAEFTPVDGIEYEVRMKFECQQADQDCCHLALGRAALYATIVCGGGEVQMMIFVKAGHFLASGFNASREYGVQVRTKLPVTDFPAGSQFYFEDTGFSTAAVPLLRLWDAGIADSGTTGSAVTGSDLTFTATRSRQRSGALLNLTQNNRYLVRATGPTSTAERLHHAHGMIVVEIPVD